MSTILVVSVLASVFVILPAASVESVQLLLGTDKGVYLHGENVTLILLNVGNKAVTIGGYPAWMILTYPDEKPVFPKFFAFLWWQLDPGKNDSFRWNQYDEFNESFVGTGDYVVRDVNGWGLSAYFSVVDIIVPDNYPTIQGAVNNANEGDTVFVRNGTYHENVVVNKTVSLVGESRNSSIIRGHYMYLQSVVSTIAANVHISGFTVQDGWCGVGVYSNSCVVAQNRMTNNTYEGGGGQIFKSGRGIWSLHSYNVTIIDNIVDHNDRGVSLEGAQGNSVESNTVLNSVVSWGIVLESSSNNGIKDNFVRSSVYDGIYLSGSDSNTVVGNLAEDNGDEGLYVGMSDNNTLAGNTVVNNPGEGIWLDWSNGSRVIGNNVTNNRKRGILCWHSGNTTVYHNEFINNSWGQAYSNLINRWDNGCEGNYWSDFNGTDTNGDGIGDTPYLIDANNADRYPLMNVYWSPCDIDHDLNVDMKDVGKSARAFGTVPGDALWNPHADITGPEPLVPDGKVDMRDVSTIARHFGEHCP